MMKDKKCKSCANWRPIRKGEWGNCSWLTGSNGPEPRMVRVFGRDPRNYDWLEIIAETSKDFTCGDWKAR